MKTSDEFTKEMMKSTEEISSVLESIIGGRKLDLNRGLIVAEHGDENECIVSINGDLTVDTEFNYDIANSVASITDYPMHIQIALLKMLERDEYTVNEDGE